MINRPPILFLPAFFWLICSTGYAQPQTVTGKVTDEQNSPLAYATIIIAGTTQGATANVNGVYSLSLTPGQYNIIFQYVGYSPRRIELSVASQPVKLDVTLQTLQMDLKEIVVTDGAEDPAYKVIRAAIKKRRYYLDLVKEYKCRVYIKGIQRLDSLPKRIAGLNVEKMGLDSTLLGIVYLSESESEYNFKQPDRIREIMFSSKVSGDNQAFSWNQASDFDFNYYKNLLNLGSLSERGFVSPISESAMLYYKYRMEGTFYENGELINKIQVIPRRKSDPVFNGHIYIVEDTWRIHSIDMCLNKEANIDFVDSLEIKQLYAPVTDSVFMPVIQMMLFKFHAFGIKGNGSFIGSFTDYNLMPLFPKKFFKGEILKVNEDANKKDSAYWEVHRPIPLTLEEIEDYRKKDSLEQLKNTKTYLDSIDSKQNKFRFSDFITGYSYYRRSSKTSIGTSSALQLLNYNTVQGFAPAISIFRTKRWVDNRVLQTTITGQYGFNNMRPGARFSFSYLYKPLRFSRISVEGGRYVRQLNELNPISPMVNSGYTLFYEENYMKLYENTWLKTGWSGELMNGLKINGSLSYHYRLPLANTSDFNFSTRNGDHFSDNNPYAGDSVTLFSPYYSFLSTVTFIVNFKQQYYTRPYEKVIIGSKYPTFKFKYSRGWKLFVSEQNFDLTEAEIADEFKLGLAGKSTFSISGGIFLNRSNIGVIELKQFKGNETIFSQSDHLHAFQLLPYYMVNDATGLIRTGTDQYFAEGHFEHHFNGFIINKIPLLRKLKLKETAGVHYLMTPDIQYAEIDFGFEHIFKFLRVEWVNAYSNRLNFKTGFLIGIEMNGLIRIESE